MTPYEKFKHFAVGDLTKGNLNALYANESFKEFYQKIELGDPRKINFPTYEKYAKWAFDKFCVNMDNIFSKYFYSRIYQDVAVFNDRKNVTVMGGIVKNTPSKNTKYIRTTFQKEIFDCVVRGNISLFEMIRVAYTADFENNTFRSCFLIPSMFKQFLVNLTDHTVYNDSIEISIYVNASNMSIFSPLVYTALLSYSNHMGKRKKGNILIPSASWGTPVISTNSLDYDSVTIVDVQSNVLDGCHKVLRDFSEHQIFDEPMNLKTHCIPSENMETVINEKFDQVFFCPPYYDLELYKGSELQSTTLYNTYEDWLKKYWEKTVKNCFDMLEVGGTFSFVMSNKLNGNNIGPDMCKISEKYFKFIESIKIETKEKTEQNKSNERFESCYILIKEV